MFLNLLYDFLKLIVRIILRIFYPDTIFINEEGLKFDNPTIVVSNHPNTLLDAVGVAARVQKRLFFLANSSLFASPVAGWLLNRLYCIPIMRKEDAEKKQVNNDHSFQRHMSILPVEAPFTLLLKVRVIWKGGYARSNQVPPGSLWGQKPLTTGPLVLPYYPLVSPIRILISLAAG
jgi:1-acyl-sn-glycerol-3-phosphate acyltransferase